MNLKGIGPYRFGSVIGEGTFSIVRLCYFDGEEPSTNGDNQNQQSSADPQDTKSSSNEDKKKLFSTQNKEGSMQTSSDRKYYAAKIIYRKKLKTCKAVEDRFETEIRVMQQMHHPGVVQIIDLYRDNDYYYVILEFCPHGDLFQFVVRHENGRLSEEEARPLFRQILETIQYLHDMRISHRDIKLENILLDANGRIKISDFGLSKFLAPLKESEIKEQEQEKIEHENQKKSLIHSFSTDCFNIPPPVEDTVSPLNIPPPLNTASPLNIPPPLNTGSPLSIPPPLTENSSPQRRASFDTGPSFPNVFISSPLVSSRPMPLNNQPNSQANNNVDKSTINPISAKPQLFNIPPPLISPSNSQPEIPNGLVLNNPISPLASIPPPIKPSSSLPFQQVPLPLITGTPLVPSNNVNTFQIPPPLLPNPVSSSDAALNINSNSEPIPIRSSNLVSRSNDNIDTSPKIQKRRGSCVPPPSLIPLVSTVSTPVNSMIPDNKVFHEDLVNTPCGSPCYASPECLSGQPYSGLTTDMWSCGVILFEMLTGQLPWTKQNEGQMFEQIKRGEYTIPKYISNGAKNLIRSLLTVNVKKRYNADQALDDIWVSQAAVQFPPCLRSNSFLSSVFLFSLKNEDNGDPQSAEKNTFNSFIEYNFSKDQLYDQKINLGRTKRANSYMAQIIPLTCSKEIPSKFQPTPVAFLETEKAASNYNKDLIIIKRQLQDALKFTGISSRRKRRHTDYPGHNKSSLKNSKNNYKDLSNLVDNNVVSLRKVDEFFRGSIEEFNLFENEINNNTDINKISVNCHITKGNDQSNTNIVYSSMDNLLNDFNSSTKLLKKNYTDNEHGNNPSEIRKKEDFDQMSIFKFQILKKKSIYMDSSNI